MGISLTFSKKKIFQSKHFTKSRKISEKAASVLLQYCEDRYTLQGVILHLCCDLGLWR